MTSNRRDGILSLIFRMAMSSFDLGFFDCDQPIGIVAGNLPHWRQRGVTYFVTFRLADALPAETIELWKREQDDWMQRNPVCDLSAKPADHKRRYEARCQKWLDAGYGSCLLRNPSERAIVADTLRHFDAIRYRLREWVIMPNHVHAIVTPLNDHSLSAILHSWKSFSATAIHRQLKQRGPLWQKESFDHIVRSTDHLQRIERYIHDNPGNLPNHHFTRGCVHGMAAT
ncbi:MAG TPA: transposase [Pirellulales bacterium]|nr:transposase [Pirellulales bacterium]